MRKKRLQHAADIACEILCGWRLINDHKSLNEFGSGSLEIDLLTQKCRYNGKEIEPLNIAPEIGLWLQRDLQTNRIPVEGIKKANLQAEFRIRPLVGERKASEIWRGNPEKYIACDITCKCTIETDEKAYRSQRTDYEEWPENWWAI